MECSLSDSEDIITLFGSYQKDKGIFSMIHWQLPAPFKAYIGSLTSEPGDLQVRDFLMSSDFDKDIKGTPRIYNRFLRRKYESPVRHLESTPMVRVLCSDATVRKIKSLRAGGR